MRAKSADGVSAVKISQKLPTKTPLFLRGAFAMLSCAGLSACAVGTAVDAGGQTKVSGTAQQLRAGRGRAGDVYLGSDVLVTDGEGNAIPCASGTMQVAVTARVGTRTVTLPSSGVSVACDGAPSDMAVVLDNSASQEGDLGLIQAAAKELGYPVLDAGGRVSVVRVSTNASKLTELASVQEEFDATLDSLWVSNGWTALYDGIRMGNETLGGGVDHDPRKDVYSDAPSFCTASKKLAIVAVTDGGDNNSSGERLYTEWDDSLDTNFEDLLKLNVNGVTTPIYTVGIGDKVDHERLEELAAASGGKHVPVDSYADLPKVFGAFSQYSDQSHKVCTTLPEDVCGDIELEVAYTFTPRNGAPVSGTRLETLHVECAAERLSGRSVTIFLTMSNPGLDPSVARSLIARTIDWVSPSVGPRVAVVLDDNHHNEYRADADFIATQLTAGGYRVTRLDEPASGYADGAFAGYDVVWFTNPGYPVDDETSMRALRSFLTAGGGIVLSGDDMAQAWGNAFQMSPYTHATFVNNGTSFCGRGTDNNGGERYTVTFEDVDNSIVSGIEGTSFMYGDDIDNTVRLNHGEEVLAWASASWGSCARIPVIVAYEPKPLDPNARTPISGVVGENGTLGLMCPDGMVVKSIDFASYGTPSGTAPAFVASSCNASGSVNIVSQACLGVMSCSVPATNAKFGDPCYGTAKRLAVAATCGAP